MIKPMIVMTTSISTKVKPASARRSTRRPLDFTNGLIALLPCYTLQSFHHPSPSRCDAEDFGRRGHSCPAFFDGIVQHGGHAGANGSTVNKSCIGLGPDQGSDLVGQLQQFENPGTPAIAGAPTAIATDRTIDRLASRKTQKPITRIGDQVLFSQDISALAAAAEDADEPLGDDRAQRRPQKKSLNTEIQKPRHGRRCSFGVER